jgi:hypothetical protein
MHPSTNPPVGRRSPFKLFARSGLVVEFLAMTGWISRQQSPVADRGTAGFGLRDDRTLAQRYRELSASMGRDHTVKECEQMKMENLLMRSLSHGWRGCLADLISPLHRIERIRSLIAITE